jgi:hypothetical protein
MSLPLSRCAASTASTLALLAAIALAGCAGSPVPMRAVAGTTFGFPISADDVNVGYGIAYGSATFPDPQRGVLAVRFTNGATTQTVPVKLVTRLVADPATPVAFSGMVATPHPVFTSIPATGQIVALVDIPRSLPEGTYQLAVRRYQTSALTTLIDEGPPESSLWSNVLYIEAGDGVDHFSPFKGGFDTIISNLLPPHVQQITPLPEVIVKTPPETAAATIDIGFPNAKATISHAYFYRRGTHSCVVEIESIDANTVRIHAIDPLGQGSDLSLVFKNTQSGYNPILKSEFVYEGGTFYDVDGDPILPTQGYEPISDVR